MYLHTVITSKRQILDKHPLDTLKIDNLVEKVALDFFEMKNIRFKPSLGKPNLKQIPQNEFANLHLLELLSTMFAEKLC